MTITLIAAGIIIGALLAAWTRHRQQRRQDGIADLARLGIELAIAEQAGDTATADQIRTEMKHRGVASIEIIDLDEQENQ